jgi:arylsulfatase A-like enzyme
MKPGRTTGLSEHVDIFPTVCALAGVPVPAQLDGKSLLPLMKDNKAAVKEISVSQYPRKLNKELLKKSGFTNNNIMGYSLRTAQYRFTVWMNDFTSKTAFDASKVYATEMYDYAKDPLEKVNVVNDKNYTTVSKELYNKMVEFFKSQENKPATN